MSRLGRIQADYYDPDRYFVEGPCNGCGKEADDCECPVCSKCSYQGPRPSASECPECGETIPEDV